MKFLIYSVFIIFINLKTENTVKCYSCIGLLEGECNLGEEQCIVEEDCNDFLEDNSVPVGFTTIIPETQVFARACDLTPGENCEDVSETEETIACEACLKDL